MQDGGLDSYVLEDQIGFRLRLANQRHLEIFSAHFPEVTPTQFSTLVKLRQCGVLSQNHLGRLVAMDAATTKGVIDRLRAKGLVQSQASVSDRRRLDISLTAAGVSFVARALPVARQVSQLTTKNLAAEELAQLLHLLDRL